MDGKMPTQVMDVLRNVEQNYNPWGIGWDQRGKWAEGLDVKTLSENPSVEYLFWVGCVGSFDEHGKKIAQSIARLLKKAGISFGILGPEEKCTGDPARRMGNEYLAQTMIKQNIETLNRYAVKKIITMCPHCFNSLKHEFPDFGGKYEVVHHSQFLARLVKEGRLRPSAQVSEAATYHDACYLGRYNDVFQEPRDILKSIPGLRVVEMERSRETSLCCGGGGGRLWMEETIGKKVSVERTEHALAAKAGTLVTACPYCTIMFDDAVKVMDIEGKLKRKDIAEILEQSVGG
jgi:Fe-S oxidoreductase